MTPRPFALDRRTFLRSTAAGAGSALLSGLAVRLAHAATGRPPSVATAGNGAYGPLVPTPDASDGVTRIALPDGFRYVTLDAGRTHLSDGMPAPTAHDGMAAFALPNGNVRLIRNQEQRDVPPSTAATAFGDPATAYDPLGPGGTVSLEVRVTASGMRELVRDFVSCNGTFTNCAGGVTPWSSWLTCEEAVDGLVRGFTKPHGYVFDVPASAEDAVAAVPLPRLGRFAHEAVAVDPRTGVVYETEDRGPGGVYRFVPDRAGDLTSGRLEMMAIKGRPQYDARTGQQVTSALPVEWVPISDPDPANAEIVSGAVFNQGLANGGAMFARPEGCWWSGEAVFFTCTSGGEAGMGQVWEYRPSGQSTGTLKLIFESPDPSLLANPDNIVVSPRGGVVLCEDSDEATQYLRGLTIDGRIFPLAANLLNGLEWAGACFSSDGETLFVNIQGSTRRPASGVPIPGYTLAIWGPWADGAL